MLFGVLSFNRPTADVYLLFYTESPGLLAAVVSDVTAMSIQNDAACSTESASLVAGSTLKVVEFSPSPSEGLVMSPQLGGAPDYLGRFIVRRDPTRFKLHYHIQEKSNNSQPRSFRIQFSYHTLIVPRDREKIAVDAISEEEWGDGPPTRASAAMNGRERAPQRRRCIGRRTRTQCARAARHDNLLIKTVQNDEE
ncbi:hypothetical protein EVAR_78379_1 [Eumeta japonica]|uniref:Uncharacterized protein n=1 Tax=Eumeta variegata TaxID=151549 RepID=A0A4C1T4K2_EUMVA|nr:hypothetical protein EVAR_78379_1 [Eumeta japonica]